MPVEKAGLPPFPFKSTKTHGVHNAASWNGQVRKGISPCSRLHSVCLGGLSVSEAIEGPVQLC